MGDAQDFRSCEKTCRSLHDLLKDDDIWAFCEQCKPGDYPERPYLNKELALIPGAIKRARKTQRQEESVIVEVLGVGLWKAAVDNVLSLLIPPSTIQNGGQVEVRGDTSFVLMNVVEGFMVDQLVRAKTVAMDFFRRTPDARDFPVVTSDDLMLQNELLLSDVSAHATKPTAEEIMAWNDPLEQPGGVFLGIGRAMRDQLVCHFSLKAGNPKMDCGAYRVAWAIFVKIIRAILAQAIPSATNEFDDLALHKSYINNNLPQKLPKRVVTNMLSGEEVIRNVAPYPRLQSDRCCPWCRKIPLVYTLVPKHVEDAARCIGIPNPKVCGNGWHVCLDDGMAQVHSSDKQASNTVAQAMAMYHFEDDDEDMEEVHGKPTTGAGEKTPNYSVIQFKTLDDGDVYIYESEEDSDDDLDQAFFMESKPDDVVLNDCDHPDGFVPTTTVPEIHL